MKRFSVMLIAIAALAGWFPVFAQDTQDADDAPYLSDDDIAAIEITLPEDVPDSAVAETNKEEISANEMPRLNGNQQLYHLLVLDRTHCVLYADISGIASQFVQYKLRHGKNGYLIAIYKSPPAGPVFPILPDNSRIMLNVMTNRRSTLKEYVNSSAFRKLVTSRKILTQMRNVLSKNF